MATSATQWLKHSGQVTSFPSHKLRTMNHSRKGPKIEPLAMVYEMMPQQIPSRRNWVIPITNYRSRSHRHDHAPVPGDADALDTHSLRSIAASQLPHPLEPHPRLREYHRPRELRSSPRHPRLCQSDPSEVDASS